MKEQQREKKERKKERKELKSEKYSQFPIYYADGGIRKTADREKPSNNVKAKIVGLKQK